jgi:homocysteine S-methyltransferase
LEKRGFHCRLPLWSTWALIERPDLVREIHGDYIRAGSAVLTAATFRTSRYALTGEGMADQADELTARAVKLAREAIDNENNNNDILVAGSIAPLEDCYQPDIAPVDEILTREHHANAESLKKAGVDLLLVETQNSRREARVATSAALASGLSVWTSLMPRSATEMFNGDSLNDTVRDISRLGVEAILVNCCELKIAAQAFTTLRKEFPALNLGLFPNDLEGSISPELFADWGAQFKDEAAIIGGCCGIGPDHIRQLATEL